MMESHLQRYFIKLSFLGESFHGWQIQKNAATVQELVNKVLGILLREPIHTVGCGRTDKGVHAKEFFAHFDCKVNIYNQQNSSPISFFHDKEKFLKSANALLGKNVCLEEIFKVRNNSHARFSALSRTYQYRVHYGKNPFLNNLSFEVHKILDLDLLNELSKGLIGRHDFRNFTKRLQEQSGSLCEVTLARWQQDHNGIYFIITANRFLWNMVRRIVGVMLKINEQKYSQNFIKKFLTNTEECVVATDFYLAPAHGLYLYKIKYPDYI